MPPAAAIGAGIGALGGLLGGQKEGGKNAGNIFEMTPEQQKVQQSIATAGSSAGYGNKQYTDPSQATGLAQQQVQGGMLSPLFGDKGTFGRTAQEEQQLAGQGFQLTPEDRTAYGQASGDITRQFGEQEQSLAQALSNRGMSSSGVAGAEFSGLQGNKMEQLAKAQQSIAQQRFQSNLQRLGQTRQFLGQLGQQGQEALNSQRGFNQSAQQQDYSQQLGRGQYAQGLMGNQQKQANENLSQYENTQHSTPLSNMFGGALTGAAGSIGGLFGGGGKSGGSSPSGVPSSSDWESLMRGK